MMTGAIAVEADQGALMYDTTISTLSQALLIWLCRDATATETRIALVTDPVTGEITTISDQGTEIPPAKGGGPGSAE